MYLDIGEFGNPNPPQCHQGYQGVALTLIDSLSTLAVIGNQSEFEKGVWWLAHEVHHLLSILSHSCLGCICCAVIAPLQAHSIHHSFCV